MTTLSRVRVAMTGFQGSPGVMTFYALDTDTFQASLRTMLVGWSNQMPSDVHMQIADAGDLINDANGEIVGAWGGDPTAEVVGLSGANYAAPAGALIRWTTGTILDGHRVKGHTFIVPVVDSIFTNGGQISSAAKANFEVDASTFQEAQSTSLVIWHRPRKARAAVGKLKALTAHDGGHGLVTGSSCSAKVTVLRSRRD